MKIKLFIILFLLPLMAVSQDRIEPLKINDSVWTIQTVSIKSNKGSREVKYSDFADSATIISSFYELIDQKYLALMNKTYEKEFMKLDSLLTKFSGNNYSSLLKENIKNALQGEWLITSIGKDSTTKFIEIKEMFVQDTLGNNLGTFEINGRDAITLNGVIKQPLPFKLSKDGLIANVNNNRYQLLKNSKK